MSDRYVAIEIAREAWKIFWPMVVCAYCGWSGYRWGYREGVRSCKTD